MFRSVWRRNRLFSQAVFCFFILSSVISTGRLYLQISVQRRGLVMQSLRLSSGYDMPTVGLGTWQAKPEEMEAAVLSALNSGYRHIDTALNYKNEEAIGKSLKKWFENGGKREDLFITSKLPNYGNRPSDVEKFAKISLEKLGLNYLDMYLIHMPFAFVLNETELAPAVNENGDFVLDTSSNPVAVWKVI